MKTESLVLEAQDDISLHAFSMGAKMAPSWQTSPGPRATADLRDRAGRTGPVFTAIIRAGNRTKVI